MGSAVPRKEAFPVKVREPGMDESRPNRRDRRRRQVAYQATRPAASCSRLSNASGTTRADWFIRPPRSGSGWKCSGIEVRDAPDVRNSAQAHYGIATDADKKDSVALIQVKLLEGVFTAPQKQEIIQRLTDAMSRTCAGLSGA